MAYDKVLLKLLQIFQVCSEGLYFKGELGLYFVNVLLGVIVALLTNVYLRFLRSTENGR